MRRYSQEMLSLGSGLPIEKNSNQMNVNVAETGAKGKSIKCPSVLIRDRTIVVAGKWIKMATAKDEEVIEGPIISGDLKSFVDELTKSSLNADIFTFPQKFFEPTPKYEGYFEYDNMAAIPLTTFDDWWNGLSQDTRRNARKATKQGVVVKTVSFDEGFARGIKGIYDETPVRQGRRFWHYGKDLETIKMETSTFLDRSEFIGAYHQGQLIGFVKLVYTDQNAHVINFLSKNASYDMRPANALMTKAVEICTQRKLAYLVYRKYVYGKSGKSSLTEFKRRNGFNEIRFPRYFIPLTTKGRIAISLRIHHGVKELLPQKLVAVLRDLRARVLGIGTRRAAATKTEPV